MLLPHFRVFPAFSAQLSKTRDSVLSAAALQRLRHPMLKKSPGTVPSSNS